MSLIDLYPNVNSRLPTRSTRTEDVNLDAPIVYARYTHDFLTGPAEGEAQRIPDPLAFERKIFVKDNAAWLLEQELRRVETGHEIVLGTATDPYQPIERTAFITRSLLEVFARRHGHRIGIVTKSRLIVRDADLLSQIAQNNTLVVHLTITTDDVALARLLEPRAPRPDLRFNAVKRLRREGITTGILCSPLLPGLTDSYEHVDHMAGIAVKAEASFFAAEPLFLKACSRPTYLNFIREHFPHLEGTYERHFSESDFASRCYRKRVEADVARACSRHGIQHRSTDALLTREPGQAGAPRVKSDQRQSLLFT